MIQAGNAHNRGDILMNEFKGRSHGYCSWKAVSHIKPIVRKEKELQKITTKNKLKIIIKDMLH